MTTEGTLTRPVRFSPTRKTMRSSGSLYFLNTSSSPKPKRMKTLEPVRKSGTPIIHPFYRKKIVGYANTYR